MFLWCPFFAYWNPAIKSSSKELHLKFISYKVSYQFTSALHKFNEIGRGY